MGAVDRDDDPPEAGVDRDRDEVGLLRSRRGGGGRRLGEEWGGNGREERGGEDAHRHGANLSKRS